jgi:hypothetical protein
MTESREQVRELASDARIETFIAMIGPAVALICVGAFLIIGWVCLAVIQHQRAQAQPPRPRELHAAPMYRESDSEDEAVNRRGGRRARAAPVAAVEEGERDLPQRERRRRRGRRAQPSAPPIDGDDNDIGDDNVIDDDFDTSPSEPVFRCKTCQMPIPASGDALACSSCGKVSVELLERTAFAFAGGGDVQTCTVCLEDIEANERVITLRCAHIYHIECISEWLLTKKICPQCLTEVT